MKQVVNRRDIFKFSIMSLVSLATTPTWGQELAEFILRNADENPGNFHLIYSDPKLKSEFLSFLKHVYNIYPEDKFHQLISKATINTKTDKETYQYIIDHLYEAKPFLSELTHALPALSTQKNEIAIQTLKFIQKRGKINGYLEIGTPGRYIGKLEDLINIEGDIFLVDVNKPSYSPLDIAERGQLTPIGEYIALNDYEPISHVGLKSDSIDVVTNYIGFHHCPLKKLNSFIKSTHRVLRKGGSLILRDHDVTGREMNAMVSLAHDVFNCGLKESWKNNHNELRFFRSLKDWVAIVEAQGFMYQGTPLYQFGDPTKNALIEFRKI